MNAPAHIIPPAFAPHAEAILRFLPGCHGRELELRCRLAAARDAASSALTRDSGEATGTLTEIQRLATTYAYAPAEPAQLEALLQALRRMMAATAFLTDFSDAKDDDARG